MARDGIGADPDDPGAGGVVVGREIAELAGLGGAAGRVVLGVEVERRSWSRPDRRGSPWSRRRPGGRSRGPASPASSRAMGPPSSGRSRGYRPADTIARHGPGHPLPGGAPRARRRRRRRGRDARRGARGQVRAGLRPQRPGGHRRPGAARPRPRAQRAAVGGRGRGTPGRFGPPGAGRRAGPRLRPDPGRGRGLAARPVGHGGAEPARRGLSARGRGLRGRAGGRRPGRGAGAWGGRCWRRARPRPAARAGTG